MTAAIDTSDVHQERDSYRQIFASTFVIAGASVVNIGVGIIRTKIVSLLLGPLGVGQISLLSSLMTTAAAVAQMGVATVGTRQVAEAHAADDPVKLATSRRALLVMMVVLATFGGAAVWCLRVPLAKLVASDTAYASSVGLLALGVSLAVAAAIQGALIRGMRNMTALASITILSAIATTIVGIPLIWWLRADGIVAYLVLGPSANFVLGYIYLGRCPKGTAAPLAALRPQLTMLLRFGVPIMGTSIVSTLVDLLIRIDVHRQLGVAGLGHFQASWMIASQYVGFVLGSMGADYYPRLAALMQEPAEAAFLVNQQTEAALLLSGPIILAMLGLAPAVIHLLYSAEFAPAADILRWQALGTAFQVISWPLGFVLLAAGAGRTYFIVETTSLLLLAGLLHVLVAGIGLQGAGIAYLAENTFYLPLVYWLAVRRISFHWSSHVKRILVTLAALLGILGVTIYTAPAWTALSSMLCLAGFSLYALRRLATLGLGSLFRKAMVRV